jgi:hypothetical protein
MKCGVPALQAVLPGGVHMAIGRMQPDLADVHCAHVVQRSQTPYDSRRKPNLQRENVVWCLLVTEARSRGCGNPGEPACRVRQISAPSSWGMVITTLCRSVLHVTQLQLSVKNECIYIFNIDYPGLYPSFL